jgi:hypothetical protein
MPKKIIKYASSPVSVLTYRYQKESKSAVVTSYLPTSLGRNPPLTHVYTVETKAPEPKPGNPVILKTKG